MPACRRRRCIVSSAAARYARLGAACRGVPERRSAERETITRSHDIDNVASSSAGNDGVTRFQEDVLQTQQLLQRQNNTERLLQQLRGRIFLHDQRATLATVMASLSGMLLCTPRGDLLQQLRGRIFFHEHRSTLATVMASLSGMLLCTPPGDVVNIVCPYDARLSPRIHDLITNELHWLPVVSDGLKFEVAVSRTDRASRNEPCCA